MTEKFDTMETEEAWQALPREMEAELNRILNYWDQQVADFGHGGFYGQIAEDNRIRADAPRGSVMHTRILWAFSAAYLFTRNPRHLELAAHAFQYIRKYMTDSEYGGLYWSVDAAGNRLEDHKQVYAQAFGIYAMSEYFRASSAPEALTQALEWYRLIERYSRDPEYGGYTDAFARDWSFLEDKRLSAKDYNASKTMNTHLHLAEAYANLYEVWPDEALKKNIGELLSLFNEKILNKSSHHLGLYFSDDWQTDDLLISYGHDIEAGWLLQSCAESIGDPVRIATSRKNALDVTDAAMEGLDEDGGLWYEYDTASGKRISEKHWWPQAEALIGFCNAWQLSGKDVYKNALIRSWDFIRHFILDKKQGEWFWGVDEHNHPLPNQDKAGIWKCPYHNSRACLEILKRLLTLNPERG